MAIRNSIFRKTAVAALAALAIGAGVTAQTGTVEARNGRNAALIVGALAAGALIAGAASAHAGPSYHAGPNYYADPYAGHAQPTYYPGHYPAQTYGYVEPVHPGHYGHRRRANHADVGFDNVRQTCFTKKQMVWDGYGWVKHKYLACR